MPCNLDKFNEKANEKAVSLAHDIYNWNGGYEEDGAADAIFQLLKEAYLAGYRQCEEDSKLKANSILSNEGSSK